MHKSVMKCYVSGGAPTVMGLCLHLLLPAVAAGAEVIRQRTFALITLCDVTASFDKVVVTNQGMLACSVLCTEDEECMAFVYEQGTECYIYRTNVKDTYSCVSSNRNPTLVYVRTGPCLNGGKSTPHLNCTCVGGYIGEFCDRVMAGCSEGFNVGGYTENGEYLMWPALAPVPFKALCHMVFGIGLTPIQARASVGVDFNRSWQEYKDGFLVSDQDFWMGNLAIHWITASQQQSLIVQLEMEDETIRPRYYNDFVMAGEDEDFAVTYTSSVTTKDNNNLSECWTGDSIKFSTYDRDNDDSAANCAQIHKAGFWFQGENCSLCNPNGDIYNQSTRMDIPSENFWPDLQGLSLKSVQMFLSHDLYFPDY